MARPGVTYQDIASAANQLLENGKQPTIELIRHLLGTGSSTTIANYLRQWRSDQDGTTAIVNRDNLSQELMTLVKELWDRLNRLAQEKITALEANHHQLVTEIQQNLTKYKTNNQRWQQLFNQWTREKERLVAENHTLEQTVKCLQKEKASLIQQQYQTLQQTCLILEKNCMQYETILKKQHQQLKAFQTKSD